MLIFGGWEGEGVGFGCGYLFEFKWKGEGVGANLRLGAYSNKYGNLSNLHKNMPALSR